MIKEEESILNGRKVEAIDDHLILDPLLEVVGATGKLTSGA